jgi:anti-sigma-K factor RskA
VLVMSPSKDKAVVLLHDLRKLPDDKTYQLWLMDKTQTAHSVGVASGQTKADQTTVINGGVADKVMFGLTVEDKPQATQPKLPPVALIAMA